jgi:cytochrome bd-type quinol oxidase subunit 2
LPNRICPLNFKRCNMSLQSDYLLARVEELVGRRHLTDRRMGYVWMLVPILPILLGIAIGASIAGIIISSLPRLGAVTGPGSAAPLFAQIIRLYALAIILVYIILLIESIAIYYLIDRRNNHFKRQQQLYNTLAKYLSTRLTDFPSPNVLRLSQLAEDSTFEEQDRPSGLWAVLNLFVTPIAGLIIAYDLTLDLRRHEERQATYQTALINALAEIGAQPQNLPPSKAHRRDALLYVILTAITGGLFWIYWFYTLLRDYNEHFHDQASAEDSTLAALKPKIPSTICPTCGGPVPEGSRFCPSCGRPQTV